MSIGSINYITPAGEKSFKAYYLVEAFNMAAAENDREPFVVAAFNSPYDAWSFVDNCNDGYSYDVVRIDNIV